MSKSIGSSRKVRSAAEYRKSMAKFKAHESPPPEYISSDSQETWSDTASVKRSRVSEDTSKNEAVTWKSYSNDFLLKLIDLVKQHPILWNKRDKRYLNNWEKKKNWQEINAELEKVLERQIDSRHVFGLLVKKYKKVSEVQHRSSGSSPQDPSWSLYTAMSFVSNSTDDSSFRIDVGFNLSEPLPRVSTSNEILENELVPGPSNAQKLYNEPPKKPDDLYKLESYTKRQPSDRLEKLMAQTNSLEKMLVGINSLKKEQNAEVSTSSLISQRLKVIETRMNSVPPTAQKKILKIIDDMLFEEESGNSNYFLNINYEVQNI